MKISDYKGEAALELLAEIIEPAAEIMTDKEVVGAFKKNKFKGVSLAIKSHKAAIIRVMAAIDGVPVEEYHCNVFTLPQKVLQILNDKELAELFISQGQMGDAKSSGSASVNTEE
jgi:hypothetical protein